MSQPLSLLPRLAAATVLSLSSLGITQVALAQVQFNAPPLSAPGNREAGASRSDTCAATMDSSGLMAVLPDTNVGVTTQGFPTIFAYVPQNNAARAELMILNEMTGEEILQSNISLPLASGDNGYSYAPAVVGVTLPDDGSVMALEEGEQYLWAMMLVCNPDNRAEDIVITGVLQRAGEDYLGSLDPAVQANLETVASVDEPQQVSIYGEAGIWQDMITELAGLVQEQPEAYLDEWNSLLTTQGLGAIADVPLFFTTPVANP
jgi:hypothetical protein